MRSPPARQRRALASRPVGRYNAGMRRSTRLGLAAAVLLIAICGAYSAIWFVIASRLEDGVRQWAASLHAQNLELSWRAIRVGGFPLALHVSLNEARLRNLAATAPNGEVRAPLLAGRASVRNLHRWQVAAPEGLSLTANLTTGTTATLSAQQAAGSVAIADQGGGTLWLSLTEPSADAGARLAAHDVELWLTLPPHQAQTHTDLTIGVAADVMGLSLPTVPAPFRNPLDELAFGVTVKGPVPTGTARRAAEAWRDAGGTLDLDQLMLRWGTLRVTGSGTVALDPDLQPMGACSAAIEGFDALLQAFVANGQMRPGDARLAQLALGILAHSGPDGRPEISTSFTVQNGEMYLGPAKLGRAPRISWE